MSAVFNNLPPHIVRDQDVRKTLVNSFDPGLRDPMLRRNPLWVLDHQAGYPPFDIDQDMLQDVLPPSSPCQPDPNAMFNPTPHGPSPRAH